MSLMREGLRTIIRTFAPIIVMLYVCYKFYDKIKDAPLIKSTVKTYRILFNKLTKKEDKKPVCSVDQ